MRPARPILRLTGAFFGVQRLASLMPMAPGCATFSNAVQPLCRWKGPPLGATAGAHYSLKGMANGAWRDWFTGWTALWMTYCIRVLEISVWGCAAKHLPT